jgi:glycosyltransferase involved in cell wall biosynthesis
MATPEVTVVIPTTGRPVLARALESVALQTTSADIEIVVVVDGDGDAPAVDDYRGSIPLRALTTGGGAGGGAARNLGVLAAQGRWIAFLDDDDTWTPDKLRLQLIAAEAVARSHRWAIVTGRVDQQIVKTNRCVRQVPVELYDDTQTIAEYLFRRRRPGSGRASVFTSTVLVDAELAAGTQWNPGLPRHQDWDWLIRASGNPKVSVHQLPETLATVYVGSASSISATSDWESSLAWAKQALVDEDKRVRIDFLFAQTLRYALQARSKKGVVSVLREAAALQTIPAAGPLVTSLSGAMSRPQLEALMSWVK